MTIVQIEWIDSTMTCGWRSAEESASGDDLKCQSIGILVYEDKEVVIISTSVSAGERHVDPLTIPRVAIVGYWEIELE